MLYDNRHFPFFVELEKNYNKIKEEFLSVQSKMVDWMEPHLHRGGWQVYGIYDFPRGNPIPHLSHRVPFTKKLIDDVMPDHGAVGFSKLKAGEIILPHKGYQGNFLRCHLGLVVPEGDCGLEVNGEKLKWQEGKCVAFDDRKEHHAWNNTSQDRIVLLVDFKHFDVS